MDREDQLKLGPNDQYFPENLPGGFFIYSAVGSEELLYADDNVIKLFGCESMAELRELTGNSFQGMILPEDLDKTQDDIHTQTMYGEHRHDYVRYRIRTKQGEIKYIEDFGHLMFGENGTSYFYVFILDVDRNEYLNRNLNSFAEAQVMNLHQDTDMLTGLMNMGSFYHSIQNQISHPVRDNSTMSIIYFDVRNFKFFNERYGFQKGDELLTRIARLLWSAFEEHLVSRFSEDHFVVCTFADEVEKRVERVHNEIVNIEEGTHVEIKAGIYRLSEECKDIGLACDHARLACNSVKEYYDKPYSVYDEAVRTRLRQQQYIVDHIDEAVVNEYLKIFYQPHIRVSTGEICGYEALARWKDPRYGMLNPGDFIETLEQFHLIHKLDIFIIRKVCEDLRATMDEGSYPVVPISVNLSQIDFDLTNIYEEVEGIRKHYGIPKELLDIEITESALTEKSDIMKTEVKRFHDNGYQIWIDDFGSGYSSLNVLVEFEFDVLKLDMKFLRSFDKNPKTGKLIDYIVSAANQMKVYTLHEGVETAEHFEFLKKIGCTKAQGYYFGKPQPLSESRESTQSAGLTWEKITLPEA
ncbi:MAG: GGDEF and EAL domain-containing protein [Lachnospiraceae bacterium]|nr:GGDEF and EAL domain-containing protein [Lachnospiraceae bacterium]